MIVDGTLVPTRDRTVSARSKNYRYSANVQVIVDADTRLVVAAGDPQPGNRNDCTAYADSGVDKVTAGAHVIADGAYRGPNCAGVIIPHRKKTKDEVLPDWKEDHNRSHRRVRARVEHVFARMKTWKILRDCRLKGDGVHHAMRGIARLHNLHLAG